MTLVKGHFNLYKYCESMYTEYILKKTQEKYKYKEKYHSEILRPAYILRRLSWLYYVFWN